MSTLKVNTVQHNSTGFNHLVKFTDNGGTENGTLCRVWCKWSYNSGTPVIDSDFNVSSLTDTSSGTVTVNFTNSLNINDYPVVCGNNLGNSATTQIISNLTTSSVRIQLRYDGGTTYDVSYNSCMIMGT